MRRMGRVLSEESGDWYLIADGDRGDIDSLAITTDRRI